MTWLSLMSAASASDMRWFIPPPIRTAYFCNIRKPGTVLRVSRIRVPVPANASTQVLVAVATPDIKVSRFNATRSARSRAWAFAERSSRRGDQAHGKCGNGQSGDGAGGPGDELRRGLGGW